LVATGTGVLVAKAKRQLQMFFDRKRSDRYRSLLSL